MIGCEAVNKIGEIRGFAPELARDKVRHVEGAWDRLLGSARVFRAKTLRVPSGAASVKTAGP